jgi:hypothetical protein
MESFRDIVDLDLITREDKEYACRKARIGIRQANKVLKGESRNPDFMVAIMERVRYNAQLRKDVDEIVEKRKKQING